MMHNKDRLPMPTDRQANTAHQGFIDEIASMSQGDLVRDIDRLEATYDFFSFDKLLNPARADWTMLGTFYDKTVLVVGNQLSALSLTLARTAKRVIHADLAPESVSFVNEIARVRKLTNVTAAQADLNRLPHEPASFDRIILADILAGAGSRLGTGSPREQQTALLADLRTRLTSDGELWIATENRLAPKHFLGQVSGEDPPFSPLLPTWANRFISKVTGRGRMSRHLTTESELRSMLDSAGYCDIAVFYAVTDYERPRFISSTARDSVIGTYVANVRQGAHLKAKVGMGIMTAADRFGHAGTFSPYFIVRATR